MEYTSEQTSVSEDFSIGCLENQKAIVTVTKFHLVNDLCVLIQCVDSSDIRHPCILNPLREPFAKKECGILLSEIFESCHPVVSSNEK